MDIGISEFIKKVRTFWFCFFYSSASFMTHPKIGIISSSTQSQRLVKGFYIVFIPHHLQNRNSIQIVSAQLSALHLNTGVSGHSDGYESDRAPSVQRLGTPNGEESSAVIYL